MDSSDEEEEQHQQTQLHTIPEETTIDMLDMTGHINGGEDSSVSVNDGSFQSDTISDRDKMAGDQEKDGDSGRQVEEDGDGMHVEEEGHRGAQKDHPEQWTPVTAASDPTGNATSALGTEFSTTSGSGSGATATASKDAAIQVQSSVEEKTEVSRDQDVKPARLSAPLVLGPGAPAGSSDYWEQVPGSPVETFDTEILETMYAENATEQDARLQALQAEFDNLNREVESWMKRGFEMQEKRAACRMNGKLQGIDKQESQTREEQQALVDFCNNLRSAFSALQAFSHRSATPGIRTNSR